MSRIVSSKEFWEDIKYKCLPNRNRDKNSLTFDTNLGKLNLSYFNTGLGFTYSFYTAYYYDDIILEALNSEEFSFMGFNIGEVSYMKDKKGRTIDINTNLCYTGEYLNGSDTKGLYHKNRLYSSHYITFEDNLFKEIKKNNEKLLKTKPLFESDFIKFCFNNYINEYQQTLLKEISQISMVEDRLKELYLESKLYDLIYTTLNTVEIQNEQIFLTNQDIESLNKAKKILFDNIMNPPSLKELAHKAAINEFKLKKGFKQLFGNTVYGLLQEHRLMEAKKLLESSDINIGEASFLVGYKSISHFSKIFKDYFGITPMQIKKESRTIYYGR
ncbi:helix-turn-helix domain-containing protein [Halarcobacter ebronensis]|uniref:AraC family transcriptional regulator n=1 Tax=Halarcobacter ebronensis TaxID=1462615 RepID=A0A4Q1AM57_9BACT|nr:AraC family transcriptional regulator [Halarcobacter ebronensis]QKF82732.1 transcriptional regulator, AraC family [Halarcobacter ebronensis]RXK06757.1 AraC family transcriptional regulator [Halarcobacter ebronensis]